MCQPSLTSRLRKWRYDAKLATRRLAKLSPRWKKNAAWSNSCQACNAQRAKANASSGVSCTPAVVTARRVQMPSNNTCFSPGTPRTPPAMRPTAPTTMKLLLLTQSLPWEAG